jgi:diguanylate cyclase (GGDEF)-like protein/PAS domain S-box-containing protein
VTSGVAARPQRIGLPITIKVTLLIVTVAMLTWFMIDRQQERWLDKELHHQLEKELEQQMRHDRADFNEQVDWLRRGARLAISQSNFSRYIDQWQPADNKVIHYNRPPRWLPPPSVLRSFFSADHAILLDASGSAREVYHHRDINNETLPPTLLQPDQLLRKLTHNQSYMTMIDGTPHILSAAHYRGPDESTKAILLLVARIDQTFLKSAIGGGRESIIGLLDREGNRVISSSHPDIGPGTEISSISQELLILGKSFFDYGASDLDLQFVSMLPTRRIDILTSRILEISSQQRLLLTLSLIGVMISITLWITHRIGRLHRQMRSFSQSFYGKSGDGIHGMDEIDTLSFQFSELSHNAMVARDWLTREADERLKLELEALAAQHQREESQSLKEITESLEVGLVLDKEHGYPRPFNPLMERFIDECRWLEPFLLDGKSDEKRIELSDRSGRLRYFTINRHPSLGPRGGVVRDTTAQHEAEREHQLLLHFPARNPNPVLRINHRGKIFYVNQAARWLVKALDCHESMQLPDQVCERLKRHIEGGMSEPVDLPVANQVIEFTLAVIEGSDFIYLYGRDVTAVRIAERDQQLASTITRTVLDAIIVTTPRGVIDSVNPALGDLTGYTSGELNGRRATMLLSPRHSRQLLFRIWRTLRRHGQWSGEIWCRRADESEFTSLARISTINDPRGEVTHYVAILSDISERKRHEERLTRLAYQDPLTHLPNRLLLLDRITNGIAHATRVGSRLAICFIDLDGFKQVNDLRGHEVGDQLLQDCATRLLASVRDSDTVARLGGDEFVVVLNTIGKIEDATQVAEKLIDSLSTPFLLKGGEARIGCSIGISIHPDHGSDARLLLKRADEAMYDGKQTGKGRFVLYRYPVDETLVSTTTSATGMDGQTLSQTASGEPL